MSVPLPQISSQPNSTNPGLATVQHSAEPADQAYAFPQMLDHAAEQNQKQSLQPYPAPGAPLTRDAKAADPLSTQKAQEQDEAAQQLLAALFPQALLQTAAAPGLAADSHGEPNTNTHPKGGRPTRLAAHNILSPELLAAPHTTAQAEAALYAASANVNATVSVDHTPGNATRSAIAITGGHANARFTLSASDKANLTQTRQHTFAITPDKTHHAPITHAVASDATKASTDTSSVSPQALSAGGTDTTFSAHLAANTSTTSTSAPMPSAAVPPAPPNISLVVPAPLANPGWGQAMAQQIGQAWQAPVPGVQQAELRLDPPELGPLRVTLHIHDNVAHAWFVSPHASVRQAVESALPHLAQQLADAGLSLGDTHVGSEQAGQQSFAPTHQSPSAQGQTTGPQASLIQPIGASPPRSSDSHLLIDTYA